MEKREENDHSNRFRCDGITIPRILSKMMLSAKVEVPILGTATRASPEKKNRTRLCLWQRRRAKKNDNTEIFLGLSNLFIMILILKDNRRTRLCNPMEIPVSHDALQPVSDEHEKFSHSGRIYDEAKSWYYDVFHYRYSTIHIFQELT